MKVYFSTSASAIDKNIHECRIIVATINDLGHKITRDWIEQAYKNKLGGYHYSKEESKKIYQDNLRALRESDVVILEASNHTFNTGYLAGLAINLKKPLLILNKDSSEKISFPMGESTTLKNAEIYSKQSDLKELIIKFLEENSDTSKDVRFNMFIGRNISNYLKREAEIKGKSKAQIVREILEEHIETKYN